MALTNFSLPTNYEFYTSGGVTSGLNATGNEFTLNDKLIRIYSGAMHYFRVPQEYWRDRLRKMRAAGLNTVETFVPWNLHEPYSGTYEFGAGDTEFARFLNLQAFLETAKEEDLFVILRPGPYVGGEFNFGGFPSWLLNFDSIKFRMYDDNYLNYLTRFFSVLLPFLTWFQFTQNGPVIAFQVENQYGYSGPDQDYLRILSQIFDQYKIKELLLTSDNILDTGLTGTIPDTFLSTASFYENPEEQLARLAQLQPNRPLFVTEYKIGGFDYWGAPRHAEKNVEQARHEYETILMRNASVNIYMFQGGTNFAFWNGAALTNNLTDNSGYQPVTTSYDYDAPLSEDGSYTDKYYMVKEMIAKYNPVQTHSPEIPEILPPIVYPSVRLSAQLPFGELMTRNPPLVRFFGKDLLAMESLPLHLNSGQSNGYIVYRMPDLNLEAGSVLKIAGHVCDTVLVLLNGKSIAPSKLSSVSDLDGFGYWRMENSSVVLNENEIKGATLDLIVEAWGRADSAKNFQYNQTFKGLWQGDVYINEKNISYWKMIPLEFNRAYIDSLNNWLEYTGEELGPTMYNAILEVSDEPRDTYIDMQDWSKGTVFVNGIALGKYAAIGPQQTLYLPAPFLHNGKNNITIFEHFAPPSDGLIKFSDKHIYVSK